MEGFIGRPPVTSFSPKERRKIRIPQKGGKNRFHSDSVKSIAICSATSKIFYMRFHLPAIQKGMIVSFHHGSVKSLTLLVILIILYQFFLQFQPNIYGYKKNKLLYNSRNTFCTARSFQKQKFRIYLCALIGLRAPRSVGCHAVPPAANALLIPLQTIAFKRAMNPFDHRIRPDQTLKYVTPQTFKAAHEGRMIPKARSITLNQQTLLNLTFVKAPSRTGKPW